MCRRAFGGSFFLNIYNAACHASVRIDKENVVCLTQWRLVYTDCRRQKSSRQGAKGNCYLYEKCDFVRTGEEIVVNKKMTLVKYVKIVLVYEDLQKRMQKRLAS